MPCAAIASWFSHLRLRAWWQPLGTPDHVGKTYRAQASVSVPLPPSRQNQQPAQYLESQVLLMESPAVAQRAASLANATLQSNSLSASDFTVPVAR